MKKYSIPPHGTNNIEQATAARDERIKSILDQGLAAGRITPSDLEQFRSLEAEFKRLSGSSDTDVESVEVSTSADVEGIVDMQRSKKAADTYTQMQEILQKSLD